MKLNRSDYRHDGHTVTLVKAPVWPNPIVRLQCETCNGEVFDAFREELRES